MCFEILFLLFLDEFDCPSQVALSGKTTSEKSVNVFESECKKNQNG